MRLDQKLQIMFPQYSRSFLSKQINQNLVLVNKQIINKNAFNINENDHIELKITTNTVSNKLIPKNIPLDIIFENDDYLVINKGKNIVVHPDASLKNQNNTIVNAVLFHCQQNLSNINGVYRPGIVHRLDKDTTGILIVAKNDFFHRHLASQIEKRTVTKIYRALVTGCPQNGVIQAPISRSLHNRQSMGINQNGKEATTEFMVLQYYEKYQVSLVEIKLLTGRTHQIRVHFKAINHPIIGDKVYGNEKTNQFWLQKFKIDSQILHAYKYTFLDLDQTIKTFTAKLPFLLEENGLEKL